jgi:hypothetical protein
VSFDRQGIADHAKNLASTIQGNLRRSLEAIGVVRGVRWQGCLGSLRCLSLMVEGPSTHSPI